MVRFACELAKLWLFIAASCLIFACSGGSKSTKNEPPPPDAPCDDDCAQPRLKQALLVAHLIAEQARILAREDYKKLKAPRITDVAYGPKPEHYLRDGTPITGPEGAPFEGVLNWHTIDFEPVPTEEVQDRTFRRRKVSGAHCFFARQPNKLTALFSVLVVHHPDRGDTLYLGGPNHPTTRVDTVPITDQQKQPLRLADATLRCAFRDDQNILGALILTFEGEKGMDIADPDKTIPYHAVFLVNASNHLRPSGRTQTIERSTDARSGEAEEVLAHVLEYPAPDIDFIGTYTELFDALTAAEEAIPPGRFKLRRDFIYPRMPYQAFIEGDAEEFCPVHTKCAPPPEHLDVDVRPKITVSRKEQDEMHATDESGDETEVEQEAEAEAEIESNIGSGPQSAPRPPRLRP